MKYATMRPPTLAVLHLADLFRNPKMVIPTIRDWQKIRRYLNGEWPKPNPKYRVTISADDCNAWVSRAHTVPFIAIDTEFTRDTNYLLLVGLGYPGNEEVLQFNHRAASPTDRYRFGQLLKNLIQTTTVIFQNAIADIPILEASYGIQYTDYKRIDDTMLAHAVLWSDWPHTLEFLASIYGEHNKFKHLARSEPYLYNAGDVVDTLGAWISISNELKSDPSSQRIYLSQSLPIVPIILRSQRRGLRTNPGAISRILSELQYSKSWASNHAICYTGYPINIGSDDQLKYELYVREGLPIQMVPRTDKWTVDGDAIAALRAITGPGFDAEEEAKNGLSVDEAIRLIEQGANPLLEARVVYASAQQQLSHYINPLIECNKLGEVIRIKDTIHPKFLIHAQASGRWSTVDPPMAQIPKKLQGIVQPFEGEKWIEWDWDQIELRILAALSGDEIYEEAFSRGWDIHTLNACDVFGWTYPSNKGNPHTSVEDEVWRQTILWGGKDDPRRRFAKVFIFRLNYGGEPKTATDIPGVKQLGLKASDLVRGSRQYLSRHPRIRQYWQTLESDAISKRESRTFMGRRRRLLVDGRNAIKRLAYNHPMQGGVSDIFNLTMVKIANALPNAIFAYGVHDAQKWAVKEDDYDRAWQVAYDIVHEPWDVNGKKVIFPATFKK